MSGKRVSFAADMLQKCEMLHHCSSEFYTTFLCTCGKQVCSLCRKLHVRTATAHSCKATGHQNTTPQAPVYTCSCGKRVCATCQEQHVATDEAHRCQCPFHNVLDHTLCSRCTCGLLICDTCTELHMMQSRLHRK